MAQNEKGEMRPNIVVNRFKHTREQNKMQDFDMLNINGGLIVRAEHPMFTTRGIVNAGDLVVGDVLVGLFGEIPVTDVDTGPRIPIIYNLTTFPDHTYFAGGVLVHNKIDIGAQCEFC